MVELPKRRMPRVERYPEPSVYAHSEENLGWAVSYADVLMVLLSFFVIFFSFGKDETNSIIQQILTSMDKKGQVTAFKTGPNGGPGRGYGPSTGNGSGTGAGEGSGDGSGSSEFASTLATVDPLNKMVPLLDELKNLGLDMRIKALIQGETIVLMLPDNTYSSGRLDLTPQGQAILDSTLKQLQKYKDKIDITFIGFSDKANVKASRNQQIRNNFDISALRATRALQKAVEQGYPMQQLKARGAAQFGRESRTLSLLINMRGES